MFIELLEDVSDEETGVGDFPAGEIVGLQAGIAEGLIRAGKAKAYTPEPPAAEEAEQAEAAAASDPPAPVLPTVIPASPVTIDYEGSDDRQRDILNAMGDMVHIGNDLTAKGWPELPALSARLGFDVSKEERAELFPRITVERP